MWLIGAVPGAVSLWLPRGWPAASLAALYASATLGLAVLGLGRWLRRPTPAPREIALLTALIAALVCVSTHDGLSARVTACCVPVGILVVFSGFFTTRWVELAGTVVLTAGMWLVAWLIFRERREVDAETRVLFGVAAVVPVATMGLAVQWALGRAAGLPHLSVHGMIVTHGIANAVGFALCSILA